MDVLSKEKQQIVIGAEGNSIRSIERLSGIKLGHRCLCSVDRTAASDYDQQ